MGALSQKWFRYITNNFLIYNICWEDPAIDRSLLGLNEESDLLTITSAGDNIFSYALDQPASITAVDANACQTALLELKIRIFQQAGYEELFELFGEGKSPEYRRIYNRLCGFLSEESRYFWDGHIHRFDEGSRGFYYSGMSGVFAQLLNYFLSLKGVHDQVDELVMESDPERRARLYEQIRQKLWKGIIGQIWSWEGFLSLAGIPSEQKEAIGDLNTFMDEVFRKVFVDQSAVTNPFWRLYLEGRYQESYLPEYLQPDNFDRLQKECDTISFHSERLSSYLERTNKRFSHFVLMDHMDWLSVNSTEEFHAEWRWIFRRSRAGAKVLFRTAYPDTHFLPDFVQDKLEFVPLDPGLLERDRVGTYPKTFLAYIHV